MNKREEGRQRGLAAGRNVKDLPEVMKREFNINRRLFQSVGDMDFASELVKYDKLRLADEPDYAVFPELRGMLDRHLGEREGFKEATGLGDDAAAYHYSFWHFCWKYLNAHHVARYDLMGGRGQCTNVFFPEGKDGVTISDNRDDVPVPWYEKTVPAFKLGPSPKTPRINWVQGGVSSAVLLDEEPKCKFPCNPHEMLPEDAKSDIREIVKFMDRYKEFWGPGNQLWVDKNLNGVMVEKANVRAAYRWPTSNGAICITACSYIDPELNKFKEERLKLVAADRGETLDTCIDAIFSRGCDKRQHRLLALTNAAAKKGVTLWDAFNVVADTAVPFPDRVCLAGETTDPAREPNANWTLTQHAAVITGDKRRGLYRSVQSMANPKPITSYTPRFVLGEGVEMQPDWQADIDAGKCVLAEEPVAAK